MNKGGKSEAVLLPMRPTNGRAKKRKFGFGKTIAIIQAYEAKFLAVSSV